MRVKTLIKRLFRPSRASVIEKMKTDWDQRARENARHYVATLQDAWRDDDFFKSGKIWVEYYVAPDLELICGRRSPGDLRVLEVGCGAGRMTKILSELFGSVDAVDISAEMISRAKDALSGCSNVRFHLTNGTDVSMLSDASIDFAFSALVFQHIPRKEIIIGYIRDVARVLKPGSVFKFQLQGFPVEEEHADTWLGVGFKEEEVRQIAGNCGFKVHALTGAGTQDFWVTLVK